MKKAVSSLVVSVLAAPTRAPKAASRSNYSPPADGIPAVSTCRTFVCVPGFRCSRRMRREVDWTDLSCWLRRLQPGGDWQLH